ncbi:transcriptional regulator, partial [Streptomyces mirabilis]
MTTHQAADRAGDRAAPRATPRSTPSAGRHRRRPELAAFLRNRRARVTPADVGMAPGLRRRTPGLRREEVAQLS